MAAVEFALAVGLAKHDHDGIQFTGRQALTRWNCLSVEAF